MAKAQGIIGNFKGKIGNTVGYQLTSSNNKQTQGIRIYQPNVKNPKTSAQAEQRAKLAPINATYRALKMIIDRGNEGLPYGNKSRLAWLKQAFKASAMPWYVKGTVVKMPVACQLTKGSLPGVAFTVGEEELQITAASVAAETVVATIGDISKILLDHYPSLKDGDQVTLILGAESGRDLVFDVFSFVIDTTDTTPQAGFTAARGSLRYVGKFGGFAGSVIISREGANGEHLRSSSNLQLWNEAEVEVPYDAASKTAAIKSYMTSGTTNDDWSEEPID